MAAMLVASDCIVRSAVPSSSMAWIASSLKRTLRPGGTVTEAKEGLSEKTMIGSLLEIDELFLVLGTYLGDLHPGQVRMISRGGFWSAATSRRLAAWNVMVPGENTDTYGLDCADSWDWITSMYLATARKVKNSTGRTAPSPSCPVRIPKVRMRKSLAWNDVLLAVLAHTVVSSLPHAVMPVM